MSVNRVFLIGHVGQEPELRYTQTGTACLNVSLATNEYWKNAEGEKKERTDWHSLVFWGRSAEVGAEHITKGMKLFVDGVIQYRSWEDQDGAKRTKTDIKVLGFEFLGRGSSASNDADQPKPQPQPQPEEPQPTKEENKKPEPSQDDNDSNSDDSDDDLPF